MKIKECISNNSMSSLKNHISLFTLFFCMGCGYSSPSNTTDSASRDKSKDINGNSNVNEKKYYQKDFSNSQQKNPNFQGESKNNENTNENNVKLARESENSQNKNEIENREKPENAENLHKNQLIRKHYIEPGQNLEIHNEFTSSEEKILGKYSKKDQRKCEIGVQIFEYRFDSLLGRGINSIVYKVTNTETNFSYAAKVYSRKLFGKKFQMDNLKDQIDQEISILSSIHSKNVIQLVEAIDDDVTDSFIIIFPLGKETLSKVIERDKFISEEAAKLVFAEVAKGILSIHENNIVHRDIKPDNIMFFDNNEIKLIDFSVSAKLENDSQLLDDTEGSPAYSSPEEHSGEEYDGKKADVWSFGVSLYEAVFGKLPFSTDDKIGTYF